MCMNERSSFIVQENNFIRRLAVSKGAVNGVFLGASVQQDGSFAWIDGSKMDYENYYPGQYFVSQQKCVMQRKKNNPLSRDPSK